MGIINWYSLFLFRIFMLWHFITSNLLWTQGLYIVAGITIVAVFSYILYRPLYYLTLIFFFFCLWFFRNPIRTCPELSYDKRIIVSPADGKIVDIQFGDVGYGFDQKVSISLSLFDAHVTWTPCNGIISDIVYTPGAFVCAWLPKSSELNEHNDLYLVHNGHHIMIRQIAGCVARRICWWVKEQQSVSACQPYGMIRFGSCVELFLPKEVILSVGIGQHVVGGQAVLGCWN